MLGKLDAKIARPSFYISAGEVRITPSSQFRIFAKTRIWQK